MPESLEAQKTAQISRIEGGLLPVISIKCQPLVPMSPLEGMGPYDVPAIGLAFCSQGEVQWAASYSLERSGEREGEPAGAAPERRRIRRNENRMMLSP